MQRTLAQYANCTPESVSGGSQAQMLYFVADAKRDIATLAHNNARLVDALQDCVALIRGDLSGPMQREGVLKEAADTLAAVLT